MASHVLEPILLGDEVTMIDRRLWPVAMLFLFIPGCSTATEAARIVARAGGEYLSDRAVDEVVPRVNAATAAAKKQVRAVTTTITHTLAAGAQTGLRGALSKLETSIDQGADTLAALAAQEADSTLDVMGGALVKLWSDAVDGSFDAVRRHLETAAAERREAVIAALDLTLAARRESELAAVRTRAWKTARAGFDRAVEESRQARLTCEADATKVDPVAAATPITELLDGCQQHYMSSIETARSASVAAVEADVATAAIALDGSHEREQLETEAVAKVKQWQSEQLAAVSARAAELRRQARERADAMVASAREQMKGEIARLRKELHERLKLPGVEALSIGDEAQIQCMVDAALDDFIDQLGEHIKLTLKKATRSGVDFVVNSL